MKSRLFDDFESVTKSEWKAKAIADLKDKDFEQLIWHTAEGLEIHPYYTQEDIAGLSTGIFSNVRPLRNASEMNMARVWENLERIAVIDAKEANQKALKALYQGADGIIFALLDSPIEFDVLIDDIILAYCPLYFTGDFDQIASFQDYAHKQLLSKANLTGGFLSAFPIKEKNAFSLIENGEPGFRTLCIKSELPSSEGKPVQQLLYVLQQAVAILDTGTDRGIDPETIFDRFIISIEMGNSYFLEIAKLRACRLLMNLVAAAYEIKAFDSKALVIHCYTSGKVGLGNDSQNSMVSNTTQAMAAILGGCNSLYVQPNERGEDRGNFSKSIARNISLVLKEEAYFDKVADPVAGAYYIECLTAFLVEKVWDAFLKGK